MLEQIIVGGLEPQQTSMCLNYVQGRLIAVVVNVLYTPVIILRIITVFTKSIYKHNYKCTNSVGSLLFELLPLNTHMHKSSMS